VQVDWSEIGSVCVDATSLRHFCSWMIRYSSLLKIKPQAHLWEGGSCASLLCLTILLYEV
jgi:hypothetical protein